jgi:prepilin-type N-terminal cleavage/methylation domain-containing protein
MKTSRQTCGFSLLEMMIAITVFTIILMAIYGSINGTWDFWHTGNSVSAIQVAGSEALTRITHDLKQTGLTGVYPFISDGDDTVTFLVPVDADGDGVKFDPMNGTIEWGADEISYAFAQDASGRGQIERRVNGVTERVIARNVTGLAFADAFSDASLLQNQLRVTLTMGTITGGMKKIVLQRTFSSIVTMRNSED